MAVLDKARPKLPREEAILFLYGRNIKNLFVAFLNEGDVILAEKGEGFVWGKWIYRQRLRLCRSQRTLSLTRRTLISHCVIITSLLL